MILALSRILSSEEPLSWISKYGTTSILGAAVPAEDQEVLDKYGWSRYPNIESCYDYDFEALGNLLNNLPAPKESESRLYAAYNDIYELLTEELTDVSEQRAFITYIHNHVKVTRMVISEWQFTLRVFNSLNNIKMAVPPSILLKNVFTRAIGEARSSDIHTVFRDWELMNRRNFEHFIHTMVNLFTKCLMSFDEYERRITNILELVDIDGCPLTAFRSVVGRAISAQSAINNSRYGKLLNMLSGGREIMTLCLLPLAYTAGEEKFKLIEEFMEKLVAFGIRIEKTLSFNPVAIQTALRGVDGHSGIIVDMLQGRLTLSATISKLTLKLQEWLGDAGQSNDSVMERLSTATYSYAMFKRVRPMLLYIVEKTDSHEALFDYDAIQIDHIYPKKPSSSCPELKNSENRHRLGNLTPFMGKNSGGSLKGNMSLGNKSFDKKRPEYLKSNIAITRSVAEHSGFTDEQIEERSRELAIQLAELTAASLEL
jgi:hypothetical protein